METVKATIADLYNMRAFLAGFQQTTTEPGKQPQVQTLVPGLINEPGVPESVKRTINKAIRILNDEIKPIDKQREEISKMELSKEEIAQKDFDLLSEEVSFQVEKINFSKIENLSLSFNYSLLYDKLFT